MIVEHLLNYLLKLILLRFPFYLIHLQHFLVEYFLHNHQQFLDLWCKRNYWHYYFEFVNHNQFQQSHLHYQLFIFIQTICFNRKTTNRTSYIWFSILEAVTSNADKIFAKFIFVPNAFNPPPTDAVEPISNFPTPASAFLGAEMA